MSDELGSEAAYSGQLRAQLPAATAEAAAALWRCVQPLLQATLLATPSLTPEAVRMLAALRGVRTQLEGMGVQAESFEPRLPEIARECPRVPESARDCRSRWASSRDYPRLPEISRGCPAQAPPCSSYLIRS